MGEREEQIYTLGIDDAVRQVNEELERIGSQVRFVNAGLNTVCAVDVNSRESIESIGKVRHEPLER